jgi:hypothetical protein
MHPVRAPLALTLLTLSLPLGVPSAAQGTAPGTWTAAPGERLRLTWSYQSREKSKHSEDGADTKTETRQVTALLTAPERGFSGKGSYALALESVTWTVRQGAFAVTVKRAGEGEGEPTDEVDLKDDDYEAVAEQAREEMLDRVQQRYRLLVKPGSAALQVDGHDGWASGFSAPSLFDLAYVHSDLPEGALRSTQTWTCPRAPEALPLYGYPGEAGQFPEVTLKLKLGADGLSAKGSGSVRFSGRTMLNWKYAGKSKITRAFQCDPQGRLRSSSETGKGSIKRTDLGKRDDGAMEVTQSLALEPLD